VSGGLVLIVAASWLLSQVLGGNALGRLGISGEPTKPGEGGPAEHHAEGKLIPRGSWPGDPGMN
jgi:hypothetical protein